MVIDKLWDEGTGILFGNLEKGEGEKEDESKSRWEEEEEEEEDVRNYCIK